MRLHEGTGDGGNGMGMGGRLGRRRRGGSHTLTPFLHVMLPGVAKSCVATSIASPSKRPAALEAPDPRLMRVTGRGNTPVNG